MASVRTAVLELSYEVAGPGDGLPVVLVHGWPDGSRGWRGVTASLNGRGWRTVVPDLRGSGDTAFLSASTPRDGQAVALAQDALDLVDALGIERFAVVGHDWGARVAYTLAALVPERMTAIAALALPYQPHGEFSMPDFQAGSRILVPVAGVPGAGGRCGTPRSDRVRAGSVGHLEPAGMVRRR